MNTDQLRRDLRALADDPAAPLVHPDLVRARSGGRQLIRRRHAKVVATVTVPAVALGTLAVTGLPSGTEEPPTGVATRPAEVSLPSPLIKEATFGWLPPGYTDFSSGRENGWFSTSAHKGSAETGSQFVVKVFPKGPEPDLGFMNGGAPAKAIATAPVGGRKAHWLQPPPPAGPAAGVARLRIQVADDQWSEIEVDGWRGGELEQTLRRVAASLKFGQRPEAFPIRIKGMPRGLTPGDVSVNAGGKGADWVMALGFAEGLHIQLMRADMKERPNWTRRSPNTRVNGYPAYYSKGPAVLPKSAPPAKGSERVCVYEIQGLTLCMIVGSDQAAGLLKPSGGIIGLAKRTKILGLDPAGWTTTPFTE